VLYLKFRTVAKVGRGKSAQTMIEVFAGSLATGRKKLPGGTLRMNTSTWLDLLKLILCGADHRGSWVKVELEADGVTVDLTNEIVSCPWEDPFDEWMNTVHASIYERENTP